jgi:hypothetical protein
MAEKIEFEASGFVSLKAQIREANLAYQALLADVNSTPAAINAAAQKVGDLKDKFDDANDAVNAMTSAGRIQAFTKGISALAGGFTAINGAMALAGDSGKDLQETMVKLQGAIALTQGITALEDIPNAFKNIKTAGVSAFTAIKTAIGATGIGLLLVALGAIYAYWEDITAAVSGVTEEQKKLNAASEANLKNQQSQLDAISAQENLLKLQGKSEEEILNLKIAETDQVIAAAEANIGAMEATKKAQVEASKRNKEILKGMVDFLSLPLTLLLETVDRIGKVLGKDFGLREGFKESVAKLIFDPEEVAKKADKTIEEARKGLTKLKNDQAGFKLQVKEIRKKEAADAKSQTEEENKAYLEALKERQKAEDELYAAKAETDDERERRSLERKQQRATEELQAEIDKYEKLKKLTKEQEATLTELKKTLGIKVLTDREALDDLLAKQAEKAKDKQIASAKDEFEKTKEQTENYYKARETEILNSGKTEEEIADALEKNELARLDSLKIAYEDYGQSVVDLDLEKAKKLAKIREEEAADEKKKQEEKKAARFAAAQATIELASSTVSQILSLEQTALQASLSNTALSEEEREKIAKESFEKQKKLQIALALIDSAKTVTSILAQYPKFDGGIAMFAALATTAVTLGFAIAKIQAVEYQSPNKSSKSSSSTPQATPSTYAEGGLLMGNSHDMGGIRTSMGELEGGEFVMNRRATANFLPLLDSINTIGNTPGPQIPVAAQQPIVKTYVVATDMSSQQEANARLNALARL